VPAGAPLQALLDAALDGDAFCLAPGSHPGPLRVAQRVTIAGPREAVVRADGTGSTISLEAAGAALVGISVDGSGGRFERLDAAVRITADDVRVEDVAVSGALFGILANRASRLVIRGNQVQGDPRKALGLRGDAIRLWEVRDSLIEGNHTRDARDLVVWYSPRNRLVGNVVERGRYGVHFMYSHDNVTSDNRMIGNVVGIFAMYSRHLRIERNLLERATGAAGMGLGAKESGDLVIRDNAIVANTTCIHLDNSPFQPDEWDVFEGNDVRGCDVGVSFQGIAERNRFAGNRFADNDVQVRIEGGGNARAAEWRGNDWGDYTGYDLDRDGVGDLPYELRSLSGDLETRNPQLGLFRGSPAMWLVEIVGHVVPLFRPETVLVDPQPRVRTTPSGAARAG
jgi:nitrous oxidase accessory protein